MEEFPCFTAEQIEGFSQVLADTNLGLTGAQIAHTLTKCKIRDVDPTNTKWRRLHNALVTVQNETERGNEIIAFIHKSMKPISYTGNPERFESQKQRLNVVLAFAGLELQDDGKLHKVKAVSTLSEAEQRAVTLKKKLLDREVHADVLVFCRAELLQLNYFHSVLEAAKSVADKLRNLSGLSCDGAQLAKEALSLGQTGKPRIAINSLKDDTSKSEQTGFTNLVIGLFGTFRNPTAHGPKIYWPMPEKDALDILSFISYVHRKLDGRVIL